MKKRNDMTKIISFANQKGGVGKSTLCLQQAFYLAEKGCSVLVVDMDGQGNTSSRLAKDVSDADILQGTKASVLFDPDVQTIRPVRCQENIDLIYTPKNDPELFEKESASLTVSRNPKKNCAALFKEYDYVLVDCPPSLGRMLVAALIMSTHVVCPIKLSGFAVDGIEGLFRTITQVQDIYNPDLEVIGIVINDMDRSVTHSRSLKKLRKALPQMVFKNIIMHRTPLDTATSDGIPVWTLTYGHVAAKETIAVLDEMLERIGAV